jgi:hypothetical protein
VHETGAPARRIQQIVAVVDLPRSGEQGIDGYPELRLVTEVDDLVYRGDLQDWDIRTQPGDGGDRRPENG